MHSRRKSPAFTLVELLVVIGIIAALIGILLPVLSGVQSRGRDIKCQSNLRQIVQGLLMYASENKGYFPYGFYWEHSNNDLPDPWDPGNNWKPKSGNFDDPYISWVSCLSQQMSRNNNIVTDNNNIRASVSPVFQCPEAIQNFPHLCSYVFNFIVGISPYYEREVGPPPNAQLKSATTTMMLKDGTALVWDSAVRSTWENNDGYLSGADIDGQRFWDGALSPQLRYFSLNDPFLQVAPGTYSNNRPVRMNTGSFIWHNTEIPAGSPPFFSYQGNLRYRHGKGTTCNVGWSDGHVSQFTAKINRADQTMIGHDALRRYFMTKWPSGAIPDQNLPY